MSNPITIIVLIFIIAAALFAIWGMVENAVRYLGGAVLCLVMALLIEIFTRIPK